MALRQSFTRLGHGYGVAIVLSGIQSTAWGQALGLLPALEEEYAIIVGYDYDNVSWLRPKRLAKELAEIAAYWQRLSGHVALIGLSIGAPMSVLVTDAMRVMRKEQLRANPEAEDRLLPAVEDDARYRVIMVDPPFGAKTMLAVAKLPQWLARLIFLLGALLTPPGIKVPGVEIPIDAQLIVPTEADVRAMFPGTTQGTYRERAREADVANQRGHSFRTWFQQLFWLSWGALKVPFEAMKGVRVDMVTCDSYRNTVVRTKLAFPDWDKRVEFRRVLNVNNAEHCGTLRYQRYFVKQFRELLRHN